MPHSYPRIVAALMLAGAVACGSIDSMRLRGQTPARQMPPRVGALPGELVGPPGEPTARTPSAGDLRGSAGASRYVGSMQICRTSAPPRGWIAVAYVGSAGQCPVRSGADSVANAAVLTRYADEAVGMELDVCVDQVVPRDWVLARDEPADGTACPGAVRGERSTTKRIRRVQ